jgi:hypothetical protein
MAVGLQQLCSGVPCGQQGPGRRHCSRPPRPGGPPPHRDRVLRQNGRSCVSTSAPVRRPVTVEAERPAGAAGAAGPSAVTASWRRLQRRSARPSRRGTAAEPRRDPRAGRFSRERTGLRPPDSTAYSTIGRAHAVAVGWAPWHGPRRGEVTRPPAGCRCPAGRGLAPSVSRRAAARSCCFYAADRARRVRPGAGPAALRLPGSGAGRRRPAVATRGPAGPARFFPVGAN